MNNRGVTMYSVENDQFTLRVTTFGGAFDMLSLSCFIAQELPKTYIGLPRLQSRYGHLTDIEAAAELRCFTYLNNFGSSETIFALYPNFLIFQSASKRISL